MTFPSIPMVNYVTRVYMYFPAMCLNVRLQSTSLTLMSNVHITSCYLLQVLGAGGDAVVGAGEKRVAPQKMGNDEMKRCFVCYYVVMDLKTAKNTPVRDRGTGVETFILMETVYPLNHLLGRGGYTVGVAVISACFLIPILRSSPHSSSSFQYHLSFFLLPPSSFLLPPPSSSFPRWLT